MVCDALMLNMDKPGSTWGCSDATYAHNIHPDLHGLHLQVMEEQTRWATCTGESFIDTFHSWVMAKALLQTCFKTHGCPAGKGKGAERPLPQSGYMGFSGWMHVTVPAAPWGLDTITLGADASGCACLPHSVAACARSPGLAIVFGARADVSTGASHPTEKPGASATAWHKQQDLQGRAKRSACWDGLWWSSSPGKAGTQRRCCQSCRCPPCHCSRSLSARPGSQHPGGGGSHQS